MNIIDSYSQSIAVCSREEPFMILISAGRNNSKGQVEPELVVHQPHLLKSNL